MNYWLMKCEPDVYSIDDLKREKSCFWEGVRNYQARNFMRDDMKEGDLALFYHSNAKPPGVAGIMRISREGYPDFTAWDPDHKYYDKKASPEKPIWSMVDVEFIEKFPRLIPLKELREQKELEGMLLLQKGSRLSIQPITAAHYKRIVQLAKA